MKKAARPFVAILALFQLSRLWSFQFFGNLIDRVETDEKVIALTFDDAPTDRTPEILDLLKSR